MQTLRKLEVFIAAAWLLIFVGGSLGQGWNPIILGGAVAVFAVWFLLRRAWPRIRRVLREKNPRRLLPIELLPPPERYGARAPVSFTAIARLLDEADLGRVEATDKRVRVVSSEGEWVEASLAEPTAGGASLSSLHLTGTDAELILLACDALVPKLGPFTVRIDGVEMFLDGTLPRVELEREFRDLQMTRMRQLQRELEALEEAPKSELLN